MAAPLSDDRLLQALRDEGVDVVEHTGWRVRARPASTGAWGPINGVMVHHTVTSGESNSVDLCIRGHSSLPGPLCHLVISKDGQAHLISNGRANHAGRGDSGVLARVRAEDYDRDSTLRPSKADTDGNARFYGFECINLGDGQDPWPEAQRDCIVRAAAAICRVYGWGARSVIGHLEWQPGKIDPRTGSGTGGVDVSPPTLRRLIDERLAHPATWSPGQAAKPSTPQQEDGVPDYLSLGMTKAFTLGPDTWTSLAWDTEWSDSLGQHPAGAQTVATGCHYNGALHIQVAGLTPGHELQARVVEDDSSGKTVKEFPTVEITGSGGDTYGTVPIVGIVGADRRIKIRIAHFGEQPVTVKRAELKLHLWKR